MKDLFIYFLHNYKKLIFNPKNDVMQLIILVLSILKIILIFILIFCVNSNIIFKKISRRP
jgi:hypothetical protein